MYAQDAGWDDKYRDARWIFANLKPLHKRTNAQMHERLCANLGTNAHAFSWSFAQNI
jgi:hypothetical protein